MTWGFLWLMLALKIPLGMLLWLVWWAVKQTPEDAEQPNAGGGGPKVPSPPRIPSHPRRPFPHHPRRGPHADPLPAPPARVRSVVARARTPER